MSKRLVKLHTIPDGSCLIHGILQAIHKEYMDNQDGDYRRKITRGYRNLMADYILEPDNLYTSREKVVEMIHKQFNINTSRGFLDFLETMYNYKPDKLAYPKEPSKESFEEYREYVLKHIDYLKDDLQNKEDIYKYIENEITQRVIKFKELLENKLGLELYLPNNFNKGVIEAVLANEKIPTGLYSELPFNCRLFTFCDGGNLIKITYEYNNLEDIVLLRDVSNFFKSNKFIGDGDVLNLIPDMTEVNLIIVNLNTKSIIHIYETTRTDRYVILHNVENIHFETVGIVDEENNVHISFDRSSDVITNILSKRSIKDF